MAHPYKEYSEHRHGRDKAKSMGYQSGGGVRDFPISGRESDLQRLRSVQGVESGRIPASGGSVAMGPGMSRITGGPKPSWLRRARDRQEDMPMAKGGKVKMTAGSRSGIGRLQKAEIASRNR